MTTTKFSRFLLIFFMAFGLSACASTSNGTYDPLEPVNRVMFDVHNSIDRAVLKPAAKAYGILPEPARQGVGNFFSNLGEPFSMVNNLLQGKFTKAGASLARFGINSTIGLAGLIDVASAMGIERHKEDFGQTLGHYGVGPGPYIFIPVLGPTTLRDGAGQVGTTTLDSNAWDEAGVTDSEYAGATVLNGLHFRHEGLDLLDEIEKSSIDYYASVRSLYLQNRASEIKDGKTDIDDLPDLDMFDDEDGYYDDASDNKEKDFK
ncbi:MAG: VacJ family lipoprotein [Parvibaculales bacterium]